MHQISKVASLVALLLLGSVSGIRFRFCDFFVLWMISGGEYFMPRSRRRRCVCWGGGGGP